MLNYKKILLLLICSAAFYGHAQTIKLLTSGKNTSLRGLSVVNEKVIWVSGSDGTVGRSLDSGNTWKWMTINGFEKTDFRDIEAFDETSAVIMGIDAPAYMLRTSDGGETWKVVYENKTKGMFLDAMEFWNDQSGIVIGDPINNHFVIARTFNGGITWNDIPENYRPVADSGEACFASSGTNIRKLDRDEACFITGGKRSRLFIRDKKIDLPILQGNESSGANSVAVKNSKQIIIVGGDYQSQNSTSKVCIVTKDAGKSWITPTTLPGGYRSCVEYITKSKWITCGLNGVDITNDDGINWISVSKQGFNVCKKAIKGNAVYLAGEDGRIAKFVEN